MCLCLVEGQISGHIDTAHTNIITNNNIKSRRYKDSLSVCFWVSPCRQRGGWCSCKVVPKASAEFHRGKGAMAAVSCLTCTSASQLFPLLLWYQSSACGQDWWAISWGHWQGAVILRMRSVSRGWSCLSLGESQNPLMGGYCCQCLPQSKTLLLRETERGRGIGLKESR